MPFSRWFCAVFAAFLVIVGCSDRSDERSKAVPAAPTTTSSLVLITIDTLRADHLGCYGSPTAETPNLDRLAAEGIRFDLATTVTNNTLPSHASILSGRYPQQIGVPRNGFPLPPEIDTLATRLSGEGVLTAAFVSASALHSSMGLDRGFELYDERFDLAELDQEQRRAEATCTEALGWLGKLPRERRFFLWIHLFDPHYPYSPPSPWDTHFAPGYQGSADGSIEYLSRIGGVRGFEKMAVSPDDIRKVVSLYDGEIAYLDRQLEGLLEVLDTERHRGTSVIVVGDHGESLTEHGYFFDHGEFVYQPSMRVPLLVRPARSLPKPARHTVRKPVQTTDVYRTALSLLDVEAHGTRPSRDLTGLWRDQPDWPGGLSFGEGCRPWAVETIYPEDFWPNAGKWQFVLDDPWKLVVAPYLNVAHLYKLDEDPGEIIDHKDAQPDIARRLLHELLMWRETAERRPLESDPENLERLKALGYVD